MVKFLDLNKQYLSIKKEIDHAIKCVIDDTAFVGGKYPKMFEDAFALYIGSKYCVSVGNGTDALEISIEALNLPENSEIIIPANSFIASSEAITRSGKKVRFCDHDEDYTISPEDLKKQINSNTSAIMVVHLYGHPADLDPIIEIAKANNLKIIEDCAQSHGALYKGRKVGTFGDIAAFSFYPGKNLGAYGDGGAIVTNNAELANISRMIANHGSSRKYEHDFEGRNSRLDSIQASILNAKLYHLDKWNAIRNTAASFYSEYLIGVGDLILPKVESWANPVFHLFVIRTEKRDELSRYLNQNEIQTGIHYPIALPSLQAYKYITQDTSYMKAVKYDKQLLSLPMGDHLTSDDAEKVVSAVREFFK
jgi:dTDP-4-amino-4,6-dideoxygalactose transaminase